MQIIRHCMLSIEVLDAYALEITRGFPLGQGDKIVSRRSRNGSTKLVFEVGQEELRIEQRRWLDEIREIMLDRLEILRHAKSRRGKTLFSWRAATIAAPSHDLALLNRQPWKQAILEAAAR